MIGCLLFTFGCFAALLGAIIFAKAKKGEQNTLGGVIFRHWPDLHWVWWTASVRPRSQPPLTR